MMTKNKSNQASKLRFLFGLSLLMISAGAPFMSFQVKKTNGSSPDVMPVYKGGIEAFYRKVQKTLKYPDEARNTNTQGKILVSFTVSEKGKVKDIEVEDQTYNLLEEIVVVGYVRSVFGTRNDPDMKILEKECRRVISYLGKFTPGMKDGKPVDVRLTLPITFKLK